MGKIIYHGTREKLFHEFDLKKINSGEGASDVIGIFFTSSLYGACYHADIYSRQPNPPTVYKCEIVDNAIAVDIDIALNKQSERIQEFWSHLPKWVSSNTTNNDCYNCLRHKIWARRQRYSWLDEFLKKLNLPNNSALSDEMLLSKKLRNLGVDVLINYESGPWRDAYLQENSDLVLNPKAVVILEVLDAIQEIMKIVGI